MSFLEPQILDVTIRDGSNLINHQFTPDRVAKIAAGLSEAGVAMAEISHGLGIGAKMMGHPGCVDDDELMEAAKKAAPQLKISAFISAHEYSLPLIPGLVDFFELGRIGVNVDQIKSAEKIVQKLKKYKKIASIQMVRTHARSPEFAADQAKVGEELGADIIYIVDSFGSMNPQQVRNYISAVKSKVKIPVGFHGHNHTGMAVPNALAAWEAGASWLDASLMGVGRGPGNTPLEILTLLFQEKGFRKEIDPEKLFQTIQEAVLPIFKHPCQIRRFDLNCAKEKLDFPQDQVIELISALLHISLEDLFKRIREKMGNEVQYQDKYLKSILEEEGKDYDRIMAELNSR